MTSARLTATATAAIVGRVPVYRCRHGHARDDDARCERCGLPVDLAGWTAVQVESRRRPPSPDDPAPSPAKVGAVYTDRYKAWVIARIMSGEQTYILARTIEPGLRTIHRWLSEHRATLRGSE